MTITLSDEYSLDTEFLDNYFADLDEKIIKEMEELFAYALDRGLTPRSFQLCGGCART
jgi:hypothetical protein